VHYVPFPTLVNDAIAHGDCRVPELADVKDSYILFFGNLHLYKGVHLLYDAYLSHPELQDHTLVIAGSKEIYFERRPDEQHVVFINRFVYELRLRFKGYVIVCFPSNKEDDEIRGFNHVEEIFRQLKLPYAHVLRKKVSFKQSDLSKEEREKVASKIEGYDLDSIRHKKVLLVDDVMTTGSSLKAGISILKGANPRKIKVLVLSKKQENKVNDNSLVKSLKKHFGFYRKFMR